MLSTKVVFYHVPKNAGTAIFEGMRKCKNFRRAHPKINHIRIKEHPPGLFEKPFAIIRHPYDRIVSAFYHMNDISNPSHFYHNATISDYRTLQEMGIDMNIFQHDPNLFLEAVYDHSHPYHKVALAIVYNFDIFKPQFYWLQDITGLMVHPQLTLLKHENLENEFKWVEKNTDCKMEWPTGNNANKRITTYNVPLTDKSKQIIRWMYKDDFKHFNFN